MQNKKPSVGEHGYFLELHNIWGRGPEVLHPPSSFSREKKEDYVSTRRLEKCVAMEDVNSLLKDDQTYHSGEAKLKSKHHI